MMKTNYLNIVLFCVLSTPISFGVKAQGCSDAGLCTAPGMTLDHPVDSATYKNQIKTGASYGLAEDDISVSGLYFQYLRGLTKKASISARINWQQNDGEAGSYSAFSDIFLTSEYQANHQWGITFGLKIPLTDGNITKDGISLPMDYQPGLGTFDLLLGTSYTKGSFAVNAGLQLPLSQNDNQYLSEMVPEESSLSQFQSTNKFNRSGDVLLRISYTFLFSASKFYITPSLLPIYHISEDTYEDGFGNEVDIKGSQGLTLNGNLEAGFSKNRHSLELGYAMPFIVRDARPDGLTRSMVTYIEYGFRF